MPRNASSDRPDLEEARRDGPRHRGRLPAGADRRRAYKIHQEVESGERPVVGVVNKFVTDEAAPDIDTYELDAGAAINSSASRRSRRSATRRGVGRPGRAVPGCGDEESDAPPDRLRQCVLHGGRWFRPSRPCGGEPATGGVLVTARILVAKPGLDGRDRGAKIGARARCGMPASGDLHRDSAAHRGHRVDRTAGGRRRVGLSILSGAHIALTKRTVDAPRQADAGDIAVIVGGTIPRVTWPKLFASQRGRGVPDRDLAGRPRPRRPCADREGGRVGMRLGVMIGAERGDMARKVKEVPRGHRVGRVGRFRHRVDAAGAQRLRRADHGVADGQSDEPHRTRHRGGAAAGPTSRRAGPAGVVRPRRCRRTTRPGGRPSHHWIVRDMLGVPYEKPAAYTRDYLEVLNAALAPGERRRRERQLHRPQSDRAGRGFADTGAGVPLGR